MKKNIARTLLAAAVLLSANSANAALVTRLDGQAVYDNDLNLTWLTNANLAASNTFGLATGTDLGQFLLAYDQGWNSETQQSYFTSYTAPSIINSDGTMNWGGGEKWIAAMNAANYLGYSDWALAPSGVGCLSCAGEPGGDMGHLFTNELGNQAARDSFGNWQPSDGLSNTGPFSNLQSSLYWTNGYISNYYNMGNGTYTDISNAPSFDFSSGLNSPSNKTSTMYVMAVRYGDSALAAPSAVPVPAAAWLFSSGLLGLIGMARRKAA